MSGRCNSCPEDARFIGPFGDPDRVTAITGIQPSTAHPEDSDQVFALDLDRTQRSSDVLERVFAELDMSFEDFYWTNVVKCPDVDSDVMMTCSTATVRELATFKKVIALGSEAYEALPFKSGMNVVRIWHPAYILRQQHKFDEYVDQWDDAVGSTAGQGTLSSFG